MNKFVKFIITALVLLFVSYGIYGLIYAGFGNYFSNASFITSGLIVILAIIVIYGMFVGLKKLWLLSVLFLFLPLIQSCNYAKSNQQVVISKDCGMTWTKVSAGDAVPKGVANPCYMKVVMPNYPMQGDCKFISNLKDRVRAVIEIDYDYTIIEPLSFIKQAKYLGKANSDADSDGALNPDAFEGAENMVIDKRIKDVSKSLFLDEDIVELDQAELENKLLVEANKVLEPLGIRLNFITLTFDLDEQTRQAIDISTAMKIYESKNISEIGKLIMVARAGAPKITIENKITPAEKKE